MGPILRLYSRIGGPGSQQSMSCRGQFVHVPCIRRTLKWKTLTVYCSLITVPLYQSFPRKKQRAEISQMLSRWCPQWWHSSPQGFQWQGGKEMPAAWHAAPCAANSRSYATSRAWPSHQNFIPYTCPPLLVVFVVLDSHGGILMYSSVFNRQH